MGYRIICIRSGGQRWPGDTSLTVRASDGVSGRSYIFPALRQQVRTRVNIFRGAPLDVQGSTFSVGFFVFSREHRDVADVYVVASLLNMRKMGAINNEKMGT